MTRLQASKKSSHVSKRVPIMKAKTNVSDTRHNTGKYTRGYTINT